MALTQNTRKPLTGGQIVTVTVTLSVAAAAIAWVAILALVGAFDTTPTYQDCTDWEMSDGTPYEEAAMSCDLMWTWGYDTEHITREEHDWNRESFIQDMNELEDRVSDLRTEGN